MAVAQACSCISDWTPSLGTSPSSGVALQSKKQKQKQKQKQNPLLKWNHMENGTIKLSSTTRAPISPWRLKKCAHHPGSRAAGCGHVRLWTLLRTEPFWPMRPSVQKAWGASNDSSPHFAQPKGWKLPSWSNLPGRFGCCWVSVCRTPLTVYFNWGKNAFRQKERIKIVILLP